MPQTYYRHVATVGIPEGAGDRKSVFEGSGVAREKELPRSGRDSFPLRGCLSVGSKGNLGGFGALHGFL